MEPISSDVNLFDKKLVGSEEMRIATTGRSAMSLFPAAPRFPPRRTKQATTSPPPPPESRRRFNDLLGNRLPSLHAMRWILLVLLLPVSCAADAGGNWEEVLQRLGLSRFLALLQQADLHRLLWQRGQQTLFVPNNEALKDIETQLGREWLKGEALAQFLLRHFVVGRWRLASLQNEQLLPSRLPGAVLRINRYPSSTDNNTSVVTVLGAAVVKSDGTAHSGIVHVLSSALHPQPLGNTLDTARSLGACRHFLSLIQDHDLSNELQYDDPITVFIPIDNAFKKLPGNFLEILKTERKALGALIRFHIADGTYHIAGMTNSDRLTSREGNSLSIHYTEAGRKKLVVVNRSAKIVGSYPVANGVVHLIDVLLVPPASPKQLLFNPPLQAF